MNQMSQEDDVFHNEYSYQRQDGNQRSSDTISLRTGSVGNTSETEYDEFNKIFHTRCATFPEPVTVYEKVKYPLWECIKTIVHTFVILCWNKAVAKGYKTFNVFGIIWFASVFFPYNERRNVSFESKIEKSVLYHAFQILILKHSLIVLF